MAVGRPFVRWRHHQIDGSCDERVQTLEQTEIRVSVSAVWQLGAPADTRLTYDDFVLFQTMGSAASS